MDLVRRQAQEQREQQEAERRRQIAEQVREAEETQREQLAVMGRHGGYPEPRPCPEHKQRWCRDYLDAWVAYEKAGDVIRVANGQFPRRAYSPGGKSTAG